MEQILEFIKQNRMFNAGETIGVGVSGGIDSMSLLHFLCSIKDDFDIDVVAITVDHCLREESAYDCAFVQSYCKQHSIRCYKFKVDCLAISKNNNLTIEEAAREGRFGIFENFIKKQMVDKIALAHHMQDQAETILFHLLRGSGTAGLKGMECVRGNYIRPFLETEKDAIVKYAYDNEIPYVDDATNQDTKYQRNFLRHKVIPLLKTKWPQLEKTICSYANLAKQDNEYISKFTQNTCFVKEKNVVSIPLNYFVYEKPVLSRIIMNALNKIDATKDIESKHIDLIMGLVSMQNGSSIDLPNKLKAIREYENVVVAKPLEKKPALSFGFKNGKIIFEGIGQINVKKSLDYKFEDGYDVIDSKKLPKDCIWRAKQSGDFIVKLNNGKKTLKEYFIDKKIPSRQRESIPVLALNNEIFVVAGVGISDKVKVDDKTTTVYKIKFEKSEN